MSEIWGIPPLQIGGPKPPFWRFRNLTANLTACIYAHSLQRTCPIMYIWFLSVESTERNQIYIIRQVRCKLWGVCYIVLKRHELWSTNGFKLDCSFYPPSINSALGFADGDQQTELNHSLSNGGQYVALTMCRRKVRVIPPEKIGRQKTSTFVRFFDNFET